MSYDTQSPLFPLGQIMTTPGTNRACLSRPYILLCLTRHQHGDWGHLCKEDAAANDEAVRSGGRIVSAYPIDPARPCKGYGENCLWVITECDRSMTTILLPSEY
ncbi:MAG: type I restriction endonuclease subunit M [Opitutae bacterium]|nr:type I restriction endonuclease subunit M [Opitutae bacterium]